MPENVSYTKKTTSCSSESVAGIVNPVSYVTMRMKFFHRTNYGGTNLMEIITNPETKNFSNLNEI